MSFATFRIFKAVLARFLFLGHSILAIGHTATVLESSYYWLLALVNVGLIIETFYSVCRRNGKETRWVCLSALIYLMATVPAICLLEHNKLEARFATVSWNETNLTVAEMQEMLISPVHLITEKIGFPKVEPDRLIELIEQTLLLLLILGRWLMPKGEITREELSELLFVYIAIASDIMELFTLFEEEKVYRDRPLRYSIFIVWGISLLQFALVLTTSRNIKKPRLGASSTKDKGFGCLNGKSVEILGIVISLMIMDGPFLAVRLYVLVSLRLLTYNIIFFTSKNILMVLLIIYRFVVLSKMSRKAYCMDDVITNETVTGKMKFSSNEVRSKNNNEPMSSSELENGMDLAGPKCLNIQTDREMKWTNTTDTITDEKDKNNDDMPAHEIQTTEKH